MRFAFVGLFLLSIAVGCIQKSSWNFPVSKPNANLPLSPRAQRSTMRIVFDDAIGDSTTCPAPRGVAVMYGWHEAIRTGLRDAYKDWFAIAEGDAGTADYLVRVARLDCRIVTTQTGTVTYANGQAESYVAAARMEIIYKLEMSSGDGRVLSVASGTVRGKHEIMDGNDAPSAAGDALESLIEDAHRQWGAAISQSSSASGAPPSTQSQELLAQSLFEKGRSLMQAGEIAQACGLFAESQRLDPSAGTLLNLAVCHESEGKIATAYVELNRALSQSIADHRPDRERIAREHIDKIGPELPRLHLTLERKPAGSVVLEIDGAPMDAAMIGFRPRSIQARTWPSFRCRATRSGDGRARWSRERRLRWPSHSRVLLRRAEMSLPRRHVLGESRSSDAKKPIAWFARVDGFFGKHALFMCRIEAREQSVDPRSPRCEQLGLEADALARPLALDEIHSIREIVTLHDPRQVRFELARLEQMDSGGGRP